MPRDRYEPIKLTQTTRYAGYQFHARVHVSGMQSFEAFKYPQQNDGLKMLWKSSKCRKNRFP